MRRSEKRRIDRRRARREARKNHDGDAPSLKYRLGIYDGNRRPINLMLRAGGIRHQPRRVREIVKGKRRMLTSAEKEKEDNFVAAILKATFRLALGGDEKDVFDDLHAELRGEKAKPYPAEMPDDPLPEHEPDGYWSGYGNHWPFGMEKDTESGDLVRNLDDSGAKRHHHYEYLDAKLATYCRDCRHFKYIEEGIPHCEKHDLWVKPDDPAHCPSFKAAKP